MTSIKVCDGVVFNNNLPFVLIAGPCQIESLDHSLFMANSIKTITNKLNIPFIFKSSFDKANRTSIDGKRGLGIEKSLEVFEKVKKEFECPILTDIHNESQPDIVKYVVDIIQIPAFLCRQTDILAATAKTGKIVNVKKGQFLAPQDVKNIVQKITYFGNKNICITERGSSFGYSNLVVDMRGLETMKSQSNVPIIIDATHATQSPGGLGGSGGGNRDFAPLLARAALASTNIAGVFMEVHQNPDTAPSDGPCMVKLENLQKILHQLKQIDDLVKSQCF